MFFTSVETKRAYREKIKGLGFGPNLKLLSQCLFFLLVN